MNRPKLLLITVRFPFGVGEEFLETEIEYLAREFEVHIVPLSKFADDEPHRPLPRGVTIHPEVKLAIPVGKRKVALWLIRHPSKIISIIKMFGQECRRLRCRPIFMQKFLHFITLGLMLNHFLSKMITQQSIDIVYSYWLSTGALAGALLREDGFARIAISRAHGGDLYHERSPWGYLPGQALTISALDKVFCISEHGANYLCNLYPDAHSKIELSRLGVRPAPSLNSPSTDGRLHLVSCAYLTPVKRIDLLVQALAQCEISVTWTHLGGGAQEEEIRSLAQNLPDNIEWRITGVLSNQDILKFYQENPVDLFINVSSSEGLPVSIMEAMSYGIPVAATDVGGSKELVISGQSGILLPANITPELIAKILTEFHQLSLSEKQSMRQNAWQIWKNRVNAEVQYPTFVNRLLSLIQS